MAIFKYCYVTPIFCQNVNPLVLGWFAVLAPHQECFALPITACWYPNSLLDSMPKYALFPRMGGLGGMWTK